MTTLIIVCAFALAFMWLWTGMLGLPAPLGGLVAIPVFVLVFSFSGLLATIGAIAAAGYALWWSTTNFGIEGFFWCLGLATVPFLWILAPFALTAGVFAILFVIGAFSIFRFYFG